MINIECIGGGQQLRTALALSALTQRPFKMTNICGNRAKPGMKKQHVTCVNALATITDAYVDGHEEGSTELLFHPRSCKIQSKVSIDIGTAGSLTLLMQALLPFYAFQEKKVTLTLRGGTDVASAPPIDFMTKVFLPQIQDVCDTRIHLAQRGFYPKGQGEVELMIKPKSRSAINLVERGTLQHIGGISFASKDLVQRNVAERQGESAMFLLKQIPPTLNIQSAYSEAASTGSGIVLWAQYDHMRVGADNLGQQGVTAETIGKETAEQLKDRLATQGLDEHVSDMIIPFLGIVGGKIRIEKVTPHIEANLQICNTFLGNNITLEKNVITAEPTEFLS